MYRDIVDEIQSRYVESKRKMKRLFIYFDWDNVPGKHEQRLKFFLVEQIEIKLGLGNSDLERELKFFKPRKDENNRNLEYRFDYDYDYWYYPKWGNEIDYDDHVFKAIIKIENECRAKLRILENHGYKTEEVLREDLIVREDNHKLHILKKEQY